MGSNIYYLPLNEEVKNYLQEIRPNEPIPQDETRRNLCSEERHGFNPINE